MLNAVTGNLDRPGGSMFPSPPVDLGRLLRTLWGPSSYDEYRSRGAGLPELVGELSVAAMPDEITRPGPRQLRGLIVVAGNPTVSGPDARKLRDAMDELELLVCIDFYLSETARHADYVLPPVSHLERSELDLVFPAFSVRNNVRYSPRAFEPAEGRAGGLGHPAVAHRRGAPQFVGATRAPGGGTGEGRPDLRRADLPGTARPVAAPAARRERRPGEADARRAGPRPARVAAAGDPADAGTSGPPRSGRAPRRGRGPRARRTSTPATTCS